MIDVRERSEAERREHDVVVGRNLLVLAVFLLVSFAKPALSLPHAAALACYAGYVGLVLHALWRVARGLAWRRTIVALYAIGILVPFSVILVNLLLLAAALRGLDLLRAGRG